MIFLGTRTVTLEGGSDYYAGAKYTDKADYGKDDGLAIVNNH